MQVLKNFFQSKYQEFNISPPLLHFVLGSCIGTELSFVQASNVFSDWSAVAKIPFSEVPGLVAPTAPYHLGYYEYFMHKKTNKSICVQSGRLHGYEGLAAKTVVQTVTGPKLAGTSSFILSNISGSLKDSMPVGSIVAIKDHINLTGKSPLTGPHFIDMMNTYHLGQTKDLIKCIKAQKLNVQYGIYAGMLGPQLETPAEIRMLMAAGADVVGMSTIWEVIALHQLKAQISCVSLVSNMAAGVGASTAIDSKMLKPNIISLLQAFMQFSVDKCGQG